MSQLSSINFDIWIPSLSSLPFLYQGLEISQPRCDFYDFGGLYEEIKIDYQWSCIDGYYELDDKTCKGIIIIKCPSLPNLYSYKLDS